MVWKRSRSGSIAAKMRPMLVTDAMVSSSSPSSLRLDSRVRRFRTLFFLAGSLALRSDSPMRFLV